LHQFVTGRNLENAHQALEDVHATITIFRHEPFWEARDIDVYKVVLASPPPEDEPVGADHVQDSSDEDSNAVKSMSSVETDDDDSTEEEILLGDRWEDSEDYTPSPIPTDRFQEHFSWTGRHRTKQNVGLKCNPMDVSTPIRAWRQIFTKAILDKIVAHTNEYGETHCKSWTGITKPDLEAFIAMLFVSGIQKRKDKPSNWFTHNSILENPIMKRIMSGKKFLCILRYLHCCPVKNHDPTSPGYDPAYKIAELRDSLEKRYLAMFIPGQELSLDETLIRAYGRIKFKVRIISKSARYGIKLYVVTDAATSYVLRVIVYTGKSTYTPGIQGEVMEEKKTVQIVTRLVEPFVGTHRTIYVDRFYTSIDLLKALWDRDLYVTGTVMANRLPKGIKVDKKSAVYRAMKRGDFLKSKFIFRAADGSEATAGLVAWRDGNMVYCLSNDCNNFEYDECRRRVDGGILRVPRPLSIARYNKSMGGVDLADQKRMQCSSTIMGLDRWWLKLFFYMLDVGTGNALVLYNEQLKIRAEGGEYSEWNMVQFKMKLVEDLTRKSMDELFGNFVPDDEAKHVCVPIPGGRRVKCAYCGVMTRETRTRFMCAECGVPLCSMGNGRVKCDCFTEAHKTKEIVAMVLKKHQQMQMKNPQRNKK